MKKLLSNKQKAVLAQLAARAYKQLQAYGCPVPSLEEWRHDETWKATGHTDSFTRATQKDYTLIYNRFAAYLGKAAIRDNTYTEMDKELHLLRDSMQRFETGPDYLAEVVRDQLHLPCTGNNVYDQLRKYAKPEHVRHLNYTVINRGRAAARKLADETGVETYEPHAMPGTLPPGGLADHVGAVRVSKAVQDAGRRAATPAPEPKTARGWSDTVSFEDEFPL